MKPRKIGSKPSDTQKYTIHSYPDIHLHITHINTLQLKYERPKHTTNLHLKSKYILNNGDIKLKGLSPDNINVT
jgi:hypothetical protein